MSTAVRTFRPHEERVCSLNHFWGGIASLTAGLLPLGVGFALGRPAGQTLGCVLFCVAFAATLLTSARYHALPDLCLSRRVWQVLDHAIIFVMIASTHTSCMLVMKDIGYHPNLLAIVWAAAIIGVMLKLPLVWDISPRVKWLLDMLGVVLYLGLGWLGLAIIQLSPHGFGLLFRSVPVQLLLIGGAGYTASVFFYVRDGEWDHNRFHKGILLSGTVHFVAHLVALSV